MTSTATRHNTSPKTLASRSTKSAHALTGTWQLIRLALRRDRITLPLWIIILGLIPASGVGAYETVFPTEAERLSLNAGMGNNPSLNLLLGPAFDLSTAGGYTAWRFGTMLPLIVGLVCIFSVIRHTRQEEDTGRLELLASTVLGRYAPITAAIAVASVSAIGTGAFVAAGMAGVGTPLSGSLAFGLSITSTGLVFTAIAAISAQFVEFSRTATGLATTLLGFFFLLRAVGDATNDVSWLVWLSPFGWANRLRPYADEQWWLAGLLLSAFVLLAVLAYVLLPRRDVGLGLLPAKPGPARASSRFRTVFALAWRMHRGALLGWIVGFAFIGGVFGSLAAGVGDFIGDSENARQMFEKLGGSASLIDAFLAAITGIFGLITSMYAVQATLRMRAEETEQRLEPLLAAHTSRWRWIFGHLFFAWLGSALVLITAGASAGLAHGLRVGNVSGEFSRVLQASIGQIPAVWIVAAVAIVLFGLFPKAVVASWAVAGVIILITLFGPVLNLPQTILKLSPFTHLPKLPEAEFTLVPVMWLVGLSALGLLIGIIGFRRRDIG